MKLCALFFIMLFLTVIVHAAATSRPRTQTGANTANEITLQSYDSNVEAYVAGTPTQVSGVFKTWIDATLAFMQQDVRIIEIGSAFGRDAAYIESQGFKVERTDATQGFVTLLQEQGYEARSFNVLTDAFEGSYDLIYASAVFLHFTPTEFAQVLAKIHQSLTSQGILSFSVKVGTGEQWETAKLGSPRYFCYWTQEALAELLHEVGFELVESYISDVFICVIARKRIKN